jgi:hypothetical protein
LNPLPSPAPRGSHHVEGVGVLPCHDRSVLFWPSDARHFYPVSFIKHTIDAMVASKYNILHMKMNRK